MLEFKTNWPETKQNFEQWWAGENTDRPLLICEPKVFYMGSEERQCFDFQGNWKEKWTNTQKVFDQLEFDYSRNHFTGEAFPFYSPYLGPGSLAAHLGCKIGFGKDTIWMEKQEGGIDAIDGTWNDMEHWWDYTKSAIQYAKERAKGRIAVSIPDIEMGLDIISAMISPNQLLFALLDEPEKVHMLQKNILDIWKSKIDELYECTREEDGFSSYSHFYIMGKGKTATLQCDFATMISPDMFEEFMLPYLREYAKHLDRNIYHLDGVDNVRHLDHILSVPEIGCIQWTPGAGKPDGGDPCWDEIYRKSLEHGKRIYALMSPDKVLDFVKRFGKKGVYIRTDLNDRKAAEELMEQLKQV